MIKKDDEYVPYFEVENQDWKSAKRVSQTLFEEKKPFQIFIYSKYCTTYDKDDKPFMMWEKISYGDFLEIADLK